MHLRFSLADKISMTIIVVGLSGIMLVYYISDSYKQFAYQHHTSAIQQLAYLEIDDLIEELEENSLDLALSIENDNNFKHNFSYKNNDDLTKHLDNQFYQYFVTAGVIKLLKLYLLDTDFTLISTSTEGVSTDIDSELICPQLSQLALKRLGSEKLQTLSRTCTYKNHPVFAVIVPFGGLNPKGYIQVITDLAYNIQKIDRSLAMPAQISLLDGHTIYQSPDWETIQADQNYLDVSLPINNDSDKTILYVSLKSDMTDFNGEIKKHRNWIMALAFVTTSLTVFIVLLILRRSTIPPLAKIHDALEKINLNSHADSDAKDTRLLFAQLLEQIICLRHRNKKSFSVMLIDLNRFKDVNSKYGKSVGDSLLTEVEQRLGSILRDSDLISWVGTDTPGHKLLPSDTETRYRATIARLGGDEFGLLLPSAETPEQATSVGRRIVETLNKTFVIDSHNIDIECKIGISIFPIHGEDEKMLIRHADKAMLQAKSNN
ncbi:MAG: GGDEF domain-containing protein, partial [Gammaproteobacteria bacterium]|nr:GGDEF domain-containing protein [Gammaproteobacteria bacterium]